MVSNPTSNREVVSSSLPKSKVGSSWREGCRGSIWKQPLYPRVGVRSAYTLPSPDPTSGISLGRCCCCYMFSNLKDMWFIEIVGLPSVEIGVITMGEILGRDKLVSEPRLHRSHES